MHKQGIDSHILVAILNPFGYQIETRLNKAANYSSFIVFEKSTLSAIPAYYE
jgi:hypothetical protein